MNKAISLVLVMSMLAGCGQVVGANHQTQLANETPELVALAAQAPSKIKISNAKLIGSKAILEYQVQRGSKLIQKVVEVQFEGDPGNTAQLKFKGATLNGNKLSKATISKSELKMLLEELTAMEASKGTVYKTQVVGVVVAVAAGLAVGAVVATVAVVTGVVGWFVKNSGMGELL